MNIKNLNVTELLKLRTDVDAALQSHRAQLEAQLASLGGKKDGRGSLKGKKVAPKYRSHENPENQWSGRGGTPRWLVEEMKSAKKKKEAFLIA